MNQAALRQRVETASGPEHRLELLLESVTAGDIDAMLVTSDESIAYLTGFRPLQFERFFGVVVSPRRSAVIVPALDAGQLAVAPAKLDRVSYGAGSDGLAELAQVLAGARSVGVEEDHLSFGRGHALASRGFELVPASSAVMDLRVQKSDDETGRIRAACELVEAAFVNTFERLRVGVTEATVNAEVEAWLREQGAEAVHPLILFGERAANPHGQPSERQLHQGDVVCADVSARLDGYWGDLTRCATVGPPSEWARAAWQVVQQAQHLAIASCRVGVPANAVDLAQRRIVEAAAELGACLHGAGHGIGLAVHEPPFLVPRTERPLLDGAVLTIEPGIYHHELGGIRIEDDVVVRPFEPEVLSQSPQELTEVGA